MRRHVPKIVLGGIVLLALVAVLSMMLREGRLSGLEQYKAQLRERGEKLTLDELAKGHDTNGIENVRHLIEIARRLPRGRDGLVMKTMSGTTPGFASVAWAQSNPPLAEAPRTWEEISAGLDSARPITLELREALGKPGIVSAWSPSELGRPATNLLAVRKEAQWLAAAAVIEMHRGRLDEASENLHSLATLAQLQQDRPEMLHQLIRAAVGRLSMAVAWELLQTNAWTDEQLARMQTDLETLKLASGFERGLEGERAQFVSGMSSVPMAKGGRGPSGLTDGMEGVVLGRLWDKAEDERFYLENMQAILDYVRSIAARQRLERVKAKAEFDRYQATMARPPLLSNYRYPLSRIALPNGTRGVDLLLDAETERELAIIVIALKRFELRQRTKAPHLGALVPEFLSALPYDCAYRLNPDGSFLLYSFGADGKDDGGDPALVEAGKDLSLWNGRDAVWPAAAR